MSASRLPPSRYPATPSTSARPRTQTPAQSCASPRPAAPPRCSPPPTPPPPTVSARPSRSTATFSSSVRPEQPAIAARPTPSPPTSPRPAPFPHGHPGARGWPRRRHLRHEPHRLGRVRARRSARRGRRGRRGHPLHPHRRRRRVAGVIPSLLPRGRPGRVRHGGGLRREQCVGRRERAQPGCGRRAGLPRRGGDHCAGKREHDPGARIHPRRALRLLRRAARGCGGGRGLERGHAARRRRRLRARERGLGRGHDPARVDPRVAQPGRAHRRAAPLHRRRDRPLRLLADRPGRVCSADRRWVPIRAPSSTTSGAGPTR